MDLTERKDAYCGLYCGACPTFIQTTAAIAAGKTDFSNPEGFCLGCKSAVVSGWCAECNLKSCAKEKGFDTCAECGDYPCEPMKGFIETPDWLYHIETPYNIALIKQIGKESWLEHQKARWSCSGCNKNQDWYAKKCESCGKDQRGYDKKC